MSAAGDVAAVAFVGLADVHEVDLSRGEPPLDLVEADRLHTLGRRNVGEEAGELEEADGAQADRGGVDLVDRPVQDNRPLEREHETGLRREAGAADGNV